MVNKIVTVCIVSMVLLSLSLFGMNQDDFSAAPKEIQGYILTLVFDPSRAFIHNGHPALTVASNRSYRFMVELLLIYGADVNTQSINGSTALTNAAYYDYKSIAKLLLKHGAHVNAQVSVCGHKDNACVSIKNKDGKTALDKAKQGYSDSQKFFPERCKRYKEIGRMLVKALAQKGYEVYLTAYYYLKKLLLLILTRILRNIVKDRAF